MLLKKMISPQNVLLVPLLAVLLLMGCQQEPYPPPKAEISHSHINNNETTIIVPPGVTDRWKSVRIAVVDKSSVSQKLYTIPIGGQLAIPSSNVVIKVETFLPAFIIEGSIITSSSNDLKNPGVKVRITENGVVIFKGWLFSMFPKTHAFLHPKFGFNLVDAVPVHH